jgi:hypothetical protein
MAAGMAGGAGPDTGAVSACGRAAFFFMQNLRGYFCHGLVKEAYQIISFTQVLQKVAGFLPDGKIHLQASACRAYQVADLKCHTLENLV